MARSKAMMPWGRYKGVRIRHLPDDYLSWLWGLEWSPRWIWLREAIRAEMTKRGFKTPEPEKLDTGFVPDIQVRRKLCLD